MRRLMVLYRDSGGMPRAWAIGPEGPGVFEHAREELAKYVAKRRALGDNVTANDFTRVVTERVESSAQ